MAAAVPQFVADPAFGLKISPSAILRSLLQQYPSGGQFLLEALQNADDTGRASKCCAMLDLRKHPATRMREPVANRATLQGESIIFYDDAGFSERDWRSLQFMCDSQKRHTVHEAGAFGMGSRSFFHITDVLQVLSHQKLSMLDPDELLGSGHFGEQTDFVKDGLMKNFPDEAAPFQGVFGCDMTKDFPGTLIRASLRNAERAKQCSFCRHPFDLSRAERIFKEFEDVMTNGEVILFLTCVRRVELWQWNEGSKEPTLIARTCLGVSSGHQLGSQLSSPKEMRAYLEKFKNSEEPFADLSRDLLKSDVEPPKIHDIVDMETEFASTGRKVKSRRWLRYGAFCTDPETVKLGAACSCVPQVTLALPISGEAAEGRVFTLMPLPLPTGLPGHMNACFRLHDNRRALWRLTKDLEGDHRLWSMWNERLLTTFVPTVYADALTYLATATGVATDYGHCAWPRESSVERDLQLILNPLVSALTVRKCVATFSGELVRPGDAVYFPSPTPALEACRPQLLELCIAEGHKVVDPAAHVVEFLHSKKALEKKPCEWVLTEVLIPAASKLEVAKLAPLLVAYLEWVGSWSEPQIVDLGVRLAGIEWVPSEDGKARTIADSFDPEQSPEALGVVRGGRAKINEVMVAAGVKSEVVWRVLRLCGVKKDITWEDAVVECREAVRTKDLKRAGGLFAHLNRHHTHVRGGRAAALKELQAADWVPARGASQKFDQEQADELLSLQKIFPQASHNVVWAVAPSLCVSCELTLKELKPVRSVESEPGILVEQLCTLASRATSFKDIVEHFRAVFAALSQTRTVAEVLLPAAAKLKGGKLASTLLVFLEGAGSWKDNDLKDLGKQLGDVKWIPVEDGSVRTFSDSFDPSQSPAAFAVVRQRRAKINALVEDARLDSDTLWRVLHLCGVKREITWEDALEEAEAVARDKDLARAGQLFEHLNKHNSQLRGGRVACLKKLNELAWVPATAPSLEPDSQKAAQLLALKDVFLPSAHKFVFAVAPALHGESDPIVLELRPGRKVEAEPAILSQQLQKLADFTAGVADTKKVMTPEAAVAHMITAFGALPSARIVSEVMLPTATVLTGLKLTSLLLTYLGSVVSWPEIEIKDLGRKLAGIKCLPTEDGEVRSIGETFDPSNSPALFSVVRERKAKLEAVFKEIGAKAEDVWKVLHLCDLKREITWEDAVDEAMSIVRDKDLVRAAKLYAHINANHAQFTGKRAAALEKLQTLAWAPATKPSPDPAGLQDAKQLLNLKELFPPSARPLVWAVAPSLCAEGEIKVHELKPGRSIESEPGVLVEQVVAIAAAFSNSKGASFAPALEHLRAAFAALPPARTLSEVAIPALAKVAKTRLTSFLLAWLELAGSWQEKDIREIGSKLEGVEWIPGEDGKVRTIKSTFDPEKSPAEFSVVRQQRASLAAPIKDAGVAAEAIWKVLRLCGIKQEISWEDAVSEAETIIKDKDMARAGKLFVHLEAHHAKLVGTRTAALEKLSGLAWVPATMPSDKAEASEAKQLLPLKDVFPPSQHRLVWAVAPSLAAEKEPTLHELMPGRNVDKEPSILASQARALAAVASTPSNGAGASKGTAAAPSVLEHLRAVFGALPRGRVMGEVLLPSTSGLKETQLPVLLLTFLEWAAAWKDEEIKEAGRKLAETKWVPTQASAACAIADTFDPSDSPEQLRVVLQQRAKIDGLLKEVGLKAEAVWKVMGLCGMKRQITWEDAVAEAESVIKDNNFTRAGALFEHLDKHHAKFIGARDASLEKLQSLPWVPAAAPANDPAKTEATQLVALKGLFAPSVRKYVWAVAPSLVASVDPSLHELRAGRKIENEPAVLVEQVKKLAELSAAAALEHYRAVFTALAPTAVLTDVVAPSCGGLKDAKLTAFLLAFVEWAGSWKEADIKELGRKLADVAWIPIEGGTRRAIADVFDPEDSPEAFKVVRERRAHLDSALKELGVRSEVVWRVLRISGVKKDLTWEDAVDEAESIVKCNDFERAKKLYAHIDRSHAKLLGKREAALEKLQQLAWVPARAQATDADAKPVAKLAALKDIFPAKESKWVWTVADSLDVDIEPTLHELKPGRSIEKESGVLVDQLRQLAEKPASAATLEPMRVVFGALAQARVLKELVLPATASLKGDLLTRLLLAFLEWASSWKEAEIKELGVQLSGVAWVPVQRGEPGAISDCFDPEQSPDDFSLVKSRRAQVGPSIETIGLRNDAVWRVLRLCGMKVELTWEDVVAEAETIVKDKDFERAAKLLTHVDKNHAKLAGERAPSLEKLQGLAWVPATAPSKDPAATSATQLVPLKSVFPPAERKLVWAVAPSLCVDTEPKLAELRPGRTVESDAGILAEQVRALVGKGTKESKPFDADVEHLRAVFAALTPSKVLTEVVLKVSPELPEKQKVSLLLAFLEWSGSLQEAQIRELGSQLASEAWVPTEDGSLQEIRKSFDPEESPEAFAIVRRCRAKIGEPVDQAGLRPEVIWRVLRLMGIKREISWEDAVDEAESVVKAQDFDRAGKLFAYLDKNHAKLLGSRAEALQKLKAVAWIPATAATTEPSAEGKASGFSPLNELFPPSARKLVWAVAPSLCVDITPTLHELMPGRDVKEEPDVLVEQVRTLVDLASKGDQDPPCVSLETLEHLRAVFEALVPLIPKVTSGTLTDHPRLKGVAFMPCLPPDDESGSALFPPRRTAFTAKHAHSALSPAIGVVKPMDYTIKMLAEACGVPKAPSAAVLAEILCAQPDNPTSSDFAVTLSIELAARIREGEEKPACVMVPTATGAVENVQQVYIDDAPWQKNNISRLHPRISAEDGFLLGCTSVRAELIRQCEDDSALASMSMDSTGSSEAKTGAAAVAAAAKDMDGDAFGQEADLVSQVMQLLQEYGDSADLVKEFIQNADDAKAESLAFFIHNDTYGSERIVDARTSQLQGPALYVCTDNPLTNEDIVRMQNVGRSKKRLDFSSSGRFGVGMNVMYRYCDCPQLLANGRLHYFDLTRSYVSHPGGSRGRKFAVEKLKENFPDSIAPFDHSLAGKFPTVFRLALRTDRSELGLPQDFDKVAQELENSASIAEKMLLFTKNLTRLEFYKCDELISALDSKIAKQEEFDAFFAKIPSSPMDLKIGSMLSHRCTKSITVTSPEGTTTAEWAIAHRLGIPDDKMLAILKEQLERPFGVALYPHGACAVRVRPFDEEHRCGRICVGLPTPFKTNSAAWIHGSFALLSSRKSLPLPEEMDKEPSLDKSWNKMLLEGVIAGAMHELISHCCSQVIFSGMKLDEFFSVFPIRGDRLQCILASSTFKASLKSAIFPVFRGSTGKVSWAAGPKPTFACEELSEDLQNRLVEDGLKLASLPPELMIEYEDALGGPRARLGGLELLQFLREAWADVHKDKIEAPKITGDGAQAEGTFANAMIFEYDLGEAGMQSLRDREEIISMLAFAGKHMWTDHLEKNKKGGWQLHKFNLLELLEGVPLLLTHKQQITIFHPKNTKFNAWRDILPSKKELFIHKDCNKAITGSVDTTAEGINREVKIDIPGIRPFTLTDLLPYREELEASLNPKMPFTSRDNEVLRQFWSLVADSALTEGAAADLAEKHGVKIDAGGDKPKWHKLVEEWPVLPVCFCDGEGENGEGIVPLHAAGSVVAVSQIATDPDVVSSLTGILKQCGVATLQAEILADERIARIITPLLVTSNKGLLQLLCDERSDIEALSGAQRHELLAYFSVLSVKGGIDLDEVAKLPLFKTADPKQSTFVPLKKGLMHCCVDPSDKHSNALCKLTPPNTVLLAWPTAQGKPIYEYCGVKLCTGEDFIASHIIPELPGICAKDQDGKASAPYLVELHAFICIDNSERVKKAAAECDWVPSEDMSATSLASSYVSTAVGAAKAFKSVLKMYLPAKWLQWNTQYMELLSALGMSSTLTPTMILICAKHLHETFTGQSGPLQDKNEKKGEKRKAGEEEEEEEDPQPPELIMSRCAEQKDFNGVWQRTEAHRDYLKHERATYKLKDKEFFAYFWQDDEDPDSTGWYIAKEVGSEAIYAVNKRHNDALIPPGPGGWEVQEEDPAGKRVMQPDCGFGRVPKESRPAKAAKTDEQVDTAMADEESETPNQVKAGVCTKRPALEGLWEITEDHKEYLQHDRPTYQKKGMFLYFWSDEEDPSSRGWYVAAEVGSEEVYATNMSPDFFETKAPPGPGKWEVIPTDQKEKVADAEFGFAAVRASDKMLATADQVKVKRLTAVPKPGSTPIGVVTDSLRAMSYELMEEFARAAEEVWPKPGSVRSALTDSSQKQNLHDMWSLLETASLNVLTARRHATPETAKKELQARNAKRIVEEKDKKGKPKIGEQDEDVQQLQDCAKLELVPLKGTAFKLARQVLWSVAPIAEHLPTPNSKGTTYLASLVSNHGEGMQNVFGSFVKAKHAPPELVVQHLSTLCSLPESEPGLVALKPCSVLHEDLKASWSYFSDSLQAIESPEVKEQLDTLRQLPCVAVNSEDVADKPVEELLLTLPKYAFFQLPLLRGKEANLRLYLRQVSSEGPRQAAVFRALGALERPGAENYAAASERVAARAAKLGRAGWDWVVACLEACVRGFHEDVMHKRLEGSNVKVQNLHMFTKDGGVECTTKLVWADVPRWLNRCSNTGGTLKIAALKGDDSREIAKTLVECAGLRELSALVEERRIQDDEGKQGGALALEASAEGEDEASKRFMASTKQLLQSFEFANGLCAVIRHTQSQNNQMANTPNEVRKELRKIEFRIAQRRLRSALFWKPKEEIRHEHTLQRAEPGLGWVCKGCKKCDKTMVRFKCTKGCEFDLCVDCYSETQRVIPGSEQDQQIYFDEGEHRVYIRGKEPSKTSAAKDLDDLSSEMVFALRRALPLLYSVDSFLLEALLGCGLRDGAAGIQGFLERRDIKVVDVAGQEAHLGPGQRLPEDLEGKLTWNMEASFGEGETAAVLINEVFTIVEVASWPVGKEPPKGSGINRSYRVRISGAMDESAYHTIKHFEIYKIPVDADAPAAPQESMEIEILSEVKEVIDEAKGAGGVTEEDEKKIADFKKYLREMSDMEADEYKTVMRRLFKTWHPDRAGDTPLSNRIFRMLRSHEQWYKKKQAGDAVGEWDDEEGDKGTVVTPTDGVMKALPAPEREYVPAEGGQSSWFDEFESEMRNKKQDNKPASKVMARPPEKPEYGPTMPEEEEDGDKKAEGGDDSGGNNWDQPTETTKPAEQMDLDAPLQGPNRIVDRQQAPIWLQQAKLELIAAKKMAEIFDGFRPLFAHCVWHCEQVVEMAIKAAMLRTCGVTEDESIGGSAHDIAEFVRRLKGADAQTGEQALAQKVPVEEDDVWWLKKAYLATRYPRPGDYRVPSENYTKADAERAIRLAEETLKWATDVEDLPDPGLTGRNSELEAQATLDIRKRRWADMVGASAGATEVEKRLLYAAVPQKAAGAPPAFGSKFAPPPKPGGPKAGPGFTAPQGKFGLPEPKGPPTGFTPATGKAPPPKGAMPEPMGPPAAASPPGGAAAGDAPAGTNRWNRHKASSPAAPGATAPAAGMASAQSSAAAAGAPVAGDKRPAYGDRVADLKERLKARKLGKPGA